MRLSTSTNIAVSAVGKEDKFTWREAMDKVKAAGFETVDLSCFDYEQPGQPIAESDWRAWAHEVREYSEKIGLPVTQGHAHWYGSPAGSAFSPLEYEEHQQKVIRDIEIAGICGIDWLVIHPDSVNDETGYSRKLSLEKNRESCLRLGEYAAKWNVGLAVENMVDRRPVTRFAGVVEDLIELMDILGDDERFGICLDTGHANLSQVNQPAAIRAMGSRLRALHINDNFGEKDDHIMPFMGTISWRPLMEALGEIHYGGEFTYEIHNYSKRFETGNHDAALRFAAETARYLVDIAEQNRK